MDIKRLHQVHYSYPNNYRRQGKTTYCFDQLLRIAQLGDIKTQAFITNNVIENIRKFVYFLQKEKVEFTFNSKNNTVLIGECKILFLSLAGKKKLKDVECSIIEDYEEN